MIAIFKLAREFDYWTWLCPRHLAERAAAGWQIRECKTVQYQLTCDERSSGPCGAGDLPQEIAEKLGAAA